MKSTKQKRRIEAEAKTGRELCEALMPYAGERGQTEGAVEVVRRVINERNEALEKIGEYYLDAKRAAVECVISSIIGICACVALLIVMRRLRNQCPA